MSETAPNTIPLSKASLSDTTFKGHTPMMQQYLRIKAQHPDMLMFYRMGDFYELFFEDAEKAARLLDITLTRRGTSAGEPVRIAGAPHGFSEADFAKIIKPGGTGGVLRGVGGRRN